MISELKKNIDLVSVVEAAGVELIFTGKKHRRLCPLHDEKTPSFFIFQDNRFKCFGCGEYGDLIDFVQKMYGLSFKDALNHLGIEQSRITPEVKQEIARRKHRAELVAAFNDWILTGSLVNLNRRWMSLIICNNQHPMCNQSTRRLKFYNDLNSL